VNRVADGPEAAPPGPAPAAGPASGSPSGPAPTVALALVSHTNVGKTTLARTLLGRDVGEVRDAPHVTEFADEYMLVRTPGGEMLTLWDTPGFGDSARLVRRLRGAERPLGWFLAQVWDRLADRAFWSSQQALRAVREHADVVLYLVNAAESPQAAGYVGPEMDLLAWVGKPVVVLLNQLGAPRPAAAEEAEVATWRQALAGRALVRAVLPMDAFARCWVQEGTLLEAVEAALAAPPDPADAPDPARAVLRSRMARLRAAWTAEREARFDAAMGLLAASLARSALARQAVADAGRLRETARRLAQAVGVGRPSEDPAALAQQALAARLDEEVRDSTAALISLHGLQGSRDQGDGEVLGQVLARVAAHYDLRRPLDEGKAAVLGGLVSGALAGLKADLASGGLTMGGGLLAGGLLGALGAAGAARAVNLVRGVGSGSVGWSDEALQAMVDAALLRYLAVAHFGRGRGDWAAGESPPHWREVVAQALAGPRAPMAEAWRAARDASVAADRGADRSAGTEAAQEADAVLAAMLKPLLAGAARETLRRLYPQAAAPAAAHNRRT
jgi:hypothetical protein